MNIIIGRHPQNGQLVLASETNVATYGDEHSVPLSVSQRHCLLTIDGESIRLKNLDINSYTYVNGQAVESKRISWEDRIGLGADGYPFDWQALDAILPPEADIRPLRQVWETFEKQNVDLQVAGHRFNILRSATGIITMAAIVLSLMKGRQSGLNILLYAVAIVLSLFFTIKAYRDASKFPQRRNELSHQFQHDYVCPHCGHFLGNQPYDILIQNRQCQYCRAKFIH